MIKISQPALQQSATSQKTAKSRLPLNTPKRRLPLNRLLEAKMLNSARGEPMRNALFPKRRAS